MANIIAMGYEGLIYYGGAGSTASSQILNSRDVKITSDSQMGDTTVRGTGALPPIETEGVSSIKWSMTLNMTNGSTDNILSALLTAAVSGTAVAIRMKDRAAGKGYDGDCNVKFDHGVPLKGEQTIDLTFTPNRDLRNPQLYV